MPSAKYVRVTAELHKAISVEAAQRETTNGDLVAAAFRAYIGLPVLQNDTLKSSHVKTPSSGGQTTSQPDTTNSANETLAKLVTMFEVLRGDFRELAAEVRRDATGSEAGGVAAPLEPGASAEASVPVRTGREPL